MKRYNISTGAQTCGVCGADISTEIAEHKNKCHGCDAFITYTYREGD